MKKVLDVYCRVSSIAQVQHGYSLDAQEKAGIKLAESLTYEFRLHIEAGQSADYDDIENRPVLKKLIDECDDGGVTDIFVTELDRLTRSPIAMHFLKKIFADNKIMVHTTSQALNFNDDDQVFMSDIMALLARRENKLRVKRSRRGMLEAVAKGKWQGAMYPYGFRRNEEGILEIDEEESSVYSKMVELCLSGMGTNTIAKHLNSLGIETRGKKTLKNGTIVVNRYTGKKRHVKNEEFQWKAGTIYCILTNAIYKGERKYRDQIFKISPLISVELWSEVQQQLTRNKNYSSNHTKIHFYLLKGLITCSKCGSNFYGRAKTDERTYMCSSKRVRACGTRSINIDTLNKVVFDIVVDNKLQLELLKKELNSTSSPENISRLKSEIKKLDKALEDHKKSKENLVILFEKSRIQLSTFDERASALQADESELLSQKQSKSAELEFIENKAESLKQLETSDLLLKVASWTDNEKQQYLNKKVKRVEILWLPAKNCHIVEITFHAGKILTEVAILNKKQIVDHYDVEQFTEDLFLYNPERHGQGKLTKDGLRFFFSPDKNFVSEPRR